MSIDLHIHTTASDGSFDPVTVVRLAKEAGLKIIALADHETTSGFGPAFREGLLHDITVIPAVELATWYKGREIHLLGYLTDPENVRLQSELAELRNQRTRCAQDTVKKLREFGFNIDWQDVQKLAESDTAVSKGHIMRAIRNAGYIENKADAINIMTKYLNYEGLAYTCHTFEFDDAVELIRSSGGIPVLAHPALVHDDDIVSELCSKNIDGLEVYYFYFGSHRQEWVNKYNLLADEKHLLKTGGSDYHGTFTPLALGDTEVPLDGVRDFLKLLGVL